MKKILIYFTIVCCFFISCKKIIDIDTNNAEPQIVIEGKIIDKLADQQVLISKTVGYSDQNIFPKVSGAVVTLQDDRGGKFTFTEKAPGVYVQAMRGIPGYTYTLTVTSEGKSYTATSKMPNNVKLDSVGITVNSFFGKERKIAAAYLVDPANETNFYHFNLFVNNLVSKRVYVSNDRLTNGNKLRTQLYYSANDDDDDGLKTGDKVSVEMECIDSNIFDYWFALSQQSGRGPNQGTTPANPTSNFSNNALGYFSAHTFQKINVVVP